MTLRQRVLFVWVPIVAALTYFVASLYLPESLKSVLLSEIGPIELGTAAGFLVAGGVALKHLHGHWDLLTKAGRLFFAAYAVTATFAGLEELSYGQHLFRYNCPSWFAEYNRQSELNFHNLMGNKPSQFLRSTASVAVPVFFVIFPWAYRRREWGRKPGHWSHAIVPESRLGFLVVIAQLVTLPHKLPETLVPYAMVDRVGEFKELYWAIAAVSYVWLMHERFRCLCGADSVPIAVTIRAAAEPVRAEQGLQAA